MSAQSYGSPASIFSFSVFIGIRYVSVGNIGSGGLYSWASKQFVDTQVELDVSVRIESHVAPEVHPLSPERFHTKPATEGEFVHFQCFQRRITHIGRPCECRNAEPSEIVPVFRLEGHEVFVDVSAAGVSS